MDMNAVSRKEVRGVIVLVAIAALFAFVVSGASFSGPLRSVELAFTSSSPNGISGGAIVPASCPSYAHYPGECDPPPPPQCDTPANPPCSGGTLVSLGADGNGCSLGYRCDMPNCPIVNPPACTGTLVAITNNTGCTTGYTCESGGGGGTGGGGGICTNLPGTFTSVPNGYTETAPGTCTANSCLGSGGACDYCPNLPGLQGSESAIPSGYRVNAQGYCVPQGGETCNIGASQTQIGVGESSTLTWSCSASATSAGLGFTTGGAPSGSKSVTPSVTTEYWLQCQAGCQDSITVEVLPFTMSITADPTTVRAGRESTITWESEGVTSCSVSGPNFSATGLNGSKLTGPIQAQSTYTLTCQTPLGVKSKSVNIRILPGTIEI